MITYDKRTPESIKEEYKTYTIKGVEQLANSLDHWMANEHNGRQFRKLASDMIKEKCEPAHIAKALFGHAYDWFAYGN